MAMRHAWSIGSAHNRYLAMSEYLFLLPLVIVGGVLAIDALFELFADDNDDWLGPL